MGRRKRREIQQKKAFVPVFAPEDHSVRDDIHHRKAIQHALNAVETQ